MTITWIRFAFIEVETLADPLAAVASPANPLAFLLNEAAYQAALNDALERKGTRRTPWDDDFGKLFWYYYLERKGEFSVTFNEAWRGLVPLQEQAVGDAAASWLKSSDIAVRGYLYPWGVAAIVDVEVRGNWTLAQAVELGLQVRASGKYDFTADGKTTPLSMNGLMSRVLAVLRRRAHGTGAPAGKAGEMWSIVTVLDAENAKDDTAVDDQGELHRAMDAFVSWSPVWQKIGLDKIGDRRIPIKKELALAGHLLYGGSHGRSIWFPGAFPSSTPNVSGSLECYHQNLVSSTLQTESLCALAASAAARLADGETLGAQSVTYSNCAKLAAGILGRLHGGNAGTYKSRSVRNQIQNHFAEVNALRKAAKQPELTLTPLNE